jgi:hypothetical protein
MNHRVILLLATILLAGALCSAGTLTVSASGTWAGGAPTTIESFPGESWSLSFQVASSPVPINFTTGVQTVVPITNLIFDLNGVPVQTEAIGGSVELFTGEGFRLSAFPDGDILQIQDATQLYSGSEASPTVLPGSYPPGFANNAFLFTNSTGFYNFTSNNIVIATDASVPEPSSFLLLGVGLAALAGVAARRIV